MSKDLDRLYNLCEKIYDEFKSDFEDLSMKVSKRVVEEMKSNNLPDKIITGENSYTNSKERLLINDRLMSLLKGHLEYLICFVL